MKRYVFFVMAIFMVITLSGQETQTKTKVAIYTTGDVDAGYKKVIGSKVTSIITQSDEYAAVERTADFLNALSQEQDYQTSGAVSDNQIVKIGQQLGVQYVVVLDISELFGSLVISARMINVCTGLIKESTEIGREVDSLEGVMIISTLVANALVGTEMYKCIGPFTKVKDLDDAVMDATNEGYRIVTLSEIETIEKIYNAGGKPINYPIYCNLSRSVSSHEGRAYWSEVEDYMAVFYDAFTIQGVLRDENKSKTSFSGCYTNANEYNFSSKYYENTSITSGYVYLIKDKK